MVKMIRFRFIQLPAEAVFQLGFYVFQPETVNGVLESGILSDGTVSVIALNRNGFSATSYSCSGLQKPMTFESCG